MPGTAVSDVPGDLASRPVTAPTDLSTPKTLTAPPLISRRARRELDRQRAPEGLVKKLLAKALGRGSPSKIVSRFALVGILAGATIVAPMAGAIRPGDPTISIAEDAGGQLMGPNTFQALMAAGSTDDFGAMAIGGSDIRAAELVDASRLIEREPLDGCSGEFSKRGTNGNVPSVSLCKIWSGVKLRADAAVALAELNELYRAQFGDDICVTSGYRTFRDQQRVKAEKGYLAAVPGTSQHGWGLAVDLCGAASKPTRAEWKWLDVNGPVFGWKHPDWARRGGAGPYEPWHWEFQE